MTAMKFTWAWNPDKDHLYFVYDTEEWRWFLTQADALEWVDGMCADPDSWIEDMENVVIGKTTHYIKQTVLGVKEDMSEEDWQDLTGDCGGDCDEWWKMNVEAWS